MTPAHATAIAQLTSSTIKLAEAAKAHRTATPKAADPALIEKAAKALVETGFVEPELEKAAADQLATPDGALKLVHDLAVKAGEEIGRLSGTGNARLAAGTQTGPPAAADPFKQAAERTSEADSEWYNRLNAIRKV